MLSCLSAIALSSSTLQYGQFIACSAPSDSVAVATVVGESSGPAGVGPPAQWRHLYEQLGWGFDIGIATVCRYVREAIAATGRPGSQPASRSVEGVQHASELSRRRRRSYWRCTGWPATTGCTTPANNATAASTTRA